MKKIISGSFIALLLMTATPATAEMGGTITRQAPVQEITINKLLTAVLELFTWKSETGTVNFENDSFTASAGCNNIFGTYSLNRTSVDFGAPASTLMFCDDKMENEAALSATLNNATHLTFNSGGFKLSNGTTTANFTATLVSTATDSN
jgi:heat shock protein HslJ